MSNSSLLRRGAEILAALIIVISTVAYTSIGIRNAGNSAALLTADGGTENISKKAEDNNTLNVENLDEPSSEGAIMDTYGILNVQNENEQSVFTADAINQNVAEDTEAVQPTENDAFTQAQQSIQPEKKYITANLLNVRSAPGADNEKLAELKRGDSIQALQMQGEWLEIITENNVRGYILAEYVSDDVPPVYKYISANTLNVRKGASAETEKLDALSKGARVQFINSSGEWANIITDKNVEGYVLAEYLSDTAPPVYKFISANMLNIRKEPSSETQKLGEITYGNRVQVFEESKEWIRILTKDGIEGYVLKEYVVDQKALPSRSSSGQSYNSDMASKVLEYAKQFAGVPYVYGGSTPNGFDCSGFTKYVFKKFNIYVPRSAKEYAGIGTKISRSNIKPGDILLFDRYNNYQLGHVGIYLGNDKFIHASTSKGKVVIATLSRYGGNILGIRRVIK